LIFNLIEHNDNAMKVTI